MISFIIPAYNCESTIRNCIESIIKNSSSSDEIIVVDDGSNDNTKNILLKISSQYNNVKIVFQENKGPNAARKAGIMISENEYVCFVDSDDLIIDCIDSNDLNSDVVLFSSSFIKTTNKIINNHDLCLSLFGINREKNPFLCSLWGKLYKKDLLLNNINYFITDIYVGEDLLWNFFVYSSNIKIKIIPKDIYYYFYNTNGVSKSYNKRLLKDDYVFQRYLFTMKEEILRYYVISEDEYNQIIYYCANNGCLLILKNEYKISKYRYSNFKTNIASIIENKIYYDALCKGKKKNFKNIDRFLLLLMKNKMYFILFLIYKLKL